MPLAPTACSIQANGANGMDTMVVLELVAETARQIWG
jgi:hypothetical protein